MLDYSTEDGEKLGGEPIIEDPTDICYRLVHRVVGDIQRACVYFDPSCEEYMKGMKIIVVESPTVNAFSSIGSIIVVYTGLIEHYAAMQEKGLVKDVEEVSDVCIQ